MKYSTRTIPVLLLAVTAMTTGCQKARKEAEARASAAEQRLVQMDAISATKDSLMREMTATTTFINEINDQLATVKPGQTKVTYDERVMPMSEYRGKILARLDSLMTRMKANQARVCELSANNKEMSGKLAMLDSTIAAYTQTIETQRQQIAMLTQQVDSLHTENVALGEAKTQLTTQVTDMTNFANRVYYVIGNKEELLAKGVASEAGGARFLGIGWKAGKTLVPARELPEGAFTVLSKPTDVEITLPKTDKRYAIVSPQNVKYLEPQPAKDGYYKGVQAIKITNPDAFWSASKYLIVVEK